MLKAIYQQRLHLQTAQEHVYIDHATTITYDLIELPSIKIGHQARAPEHHAFYPIRRRRRYPRKPRFLLLGRMLISAVRATHGGGAMDSDLCGAFQLSERRRKPRVL